RGQDLQDGRLGFRPGITPSHSHLLSANYLPAGGAGRPAVSCTRPFRSESRCGGRAALAAQRLRPRFAVLSGFGKPGCRRLGASQTRPTNRGGKTVARHQSRWYALLTLFSFVRRSSRPLPGSSRSPSFPPKTDLKSWFLLIREAAIMAPKSPRNRVSTLPAHRRLARFVRPRCEPLESRITPALFNVQSPLTFAGLNNNGCVAVADLNKDGLPDAVLTNFGLDYGALAGTTITVLYGKAGGGFSRINLNTSGQNVSFASIADINGDTWPDVVVTNANRQNTGSVSVFKNEGAGNLSLVGTPVSTFSNNPSWVGLADVTGDGVLDAIVASFGKDAGAGSNVVGNNVTIFQGNSDGQGHGDFTFSAGPITTLAPAIEFVPTALAVAD